MCAILAVGKEWSLKYHPVHRPSLEEEVLWAKKIF
jgi:hypothetical protein